MSGSNPNWQFGYVPPPSEWNGWWATKADVNNMVLSTLASGPSYANDAAAADGGVPIGGIYRNGNFVMIRLT